MRFERARYHEFPWCATLKVAKWWQEALETSVVPALALFQVYKQLMIPNLEPQLRDERNLPGRHSTLQWDPMARPDFLDAWERLPQHAVAARQARALDEHRAAEEGVLRIPVL